MWEGADLDEHTEENLDALDGLDGCEIGYLLRMGGIDVSDPTSAAVDLYPDNQEKTDEH